MSHTAAVEAGGGDHAVDDDATVTTPIAQTPIVTTVQHEQPAD
jgi:hypothetical protein